MLFDEFCEYTGDLSTDTEIEMKKYTKQNILEQRKTKGEIQNHRRSIVAYQSIDRQEFQRREAKQAESLPIDRAKPADRSAQLCESHRRNADRSWNISRSIASPMNPRQH